MQKLIAGLLIAVLCFMLFLAVQMSTISRRLDTKAQAEQDMLRARIIVLEKNVEWLKAKQEDR